MKHLLQAMVGFSQLLHTRKRVYFERFFSPSVALTWPTCFSVVDWLDAQLLCSPPAVFWVTRTASSATSCRSASKTTVLAVPTEWSAWLWYNWKKSQRRETARAGVRWANVFIWTTPASPPWGSSPSDPTTTWLRSLWGWNRRLDLRRREDEESWRGKGEGQKGWKVSLIWQWEKDLLSCQKAGSYFL